jgi:hypothetical protein
MAGKEREREGACERHTPDATYTMDKWTIIRKEEREAKREKRGREGV